MAPTPRARSERRAVAAGWKVWFGNTSMTPARATSRIQRWAQWPRTSVISGIGCVAAAPRRGARRRARRRQQGRGARAEQRREIATRDGAALPDAAEGAGHGGQIDAPLEVL